MVFADIVLPLAQPVYTFAVDEGLHVVPGTAVAVQFGPHKIYTGLVWRVHDRRPDARRIKTVSRTLYDRPLLSPAQMRFWEWTADYYMCTLGEVMRAALPALMKPSGDTEEAFAEEEFRPRTEPFALLADGLRDERALDELFERLARRAPKQYEALLEIASAGPEGRSPAGCCMPTARSSARSPARGISGSSSCPATTSAPPGARSRRPSRPRSKARRSPPSAGSSRSASPCCCTASPARARPRSTST